MSRNEVEFYPFYCSQNVLNYLDFERHLMKVFLVVHTKIDIFMFYYPYRSFLSSPIRSGADPGEGGHMARAHLRLEKIWFFWRKIVIFHTKYPKNVRASLCSAQFFKCAPLNWNPGSAPVWHILQRNPSLFLNCGSCWYVVNLGSCETISRRLSWLIIFRSQVMTCPDGL